MSSSPSATSPIGGDSGTLTTATPYGPRIRRVIPTQTPRVLSSHSFASSLEESHSDTQNDVASNSYSSSDSESDDGTSAEITQEENQDIDGLGTFDRRNPTHQSVRLGQQRITLERSHVVEPSQGNVYSSFRLRSRPARIEWEPPFQHKQVKMKAKKAVKGAIKINQPVKAKEKSTISCTCCKRRPIDHDTEAKIEQTELPATELSPEMEKANSEGYNMMKSVFFPSIPSLLQDIWVYLELLISVAAFAIGILGLFPIEENIAFQLFYLILASIALVMALMDGFIYFFQLGSCARGYRFIRETLRKRRSRLNEDEDEEDVPKKKCGMSSELQEKFNTWFELARNLINEFLVYPLLICDLFAFVDEGLSGGFLPDSDDGVGNVDFSFFVIGGFYLILAVYIMRIVMVFGTLLSLVRLPSNKNASGSDKGTGLMIKFCIHVIGQIAVHFIIIMVLAAKIHNENNLPPTLLNDTFANLTHNITTNTTVEITNGREGIIASPFLIVAIVMGGLLPLAGVAAFFIVNYYWMREFSIGFWLNMLSLLQGPSFAETVFGGDGLTSAKEQANAFLDDSGYDAVKSQIGRLKAEPWWTKFLYPTRIPVVALCGLLYDVCLVIFVASLMLTYKNNVVQIAVFQDDDVMSSTFVLAIIVIVLANLHVLLLLNFLLLVLVLIGIAIGMYSFIALPIVVFVYLPSVGLLGYFFLFRDFKRKYTRKKIKTAFNPARESNLTLKNDSLPDTYDIEKHDEMKTDVSLDVFNDDEYEEASNTVFVNIGATRNLLDESHA